MTERSLQITYRKGRPFAAYLHLSHPTGEKSVKTKPWPDGLLVPACKVRAGLFQLPRLDDPPVLGPAQSIELVALEG